ncbi:fruiting body protein SC1 [Schizophyllum commune]
MRFSLAILALPVLAAATAVPRGGAAKCNSGPVQCCNTLVDTKDKHQTNIVGALLGLDLGSLTGLAGVNCSPVSVIGVGGNSCSTQTVCCEGTQFNGLVNVGCTPINVGL